MPGVQTAPAPLSAGVAGPTLTLGAPGRVETATSRSTEVRTLRALVNILAVVSGAQLAVTLWAGAQERADQILAVELALVGLSQTLIHVWK